MFHTVAIRAGLAVALMTGSAVHAQQLPRQLTGPAGSLKVDRSAAVQADTPFTYSNYGIWDFRIESIERDEQGLWQAVVWVRDAATRRVGLAEEGVMITMFDSDGRSIATYGTLFRASVTGSLQELETIPQTMWMEKGDEIRVRLVFPRSAGFDPVRLRLWSNDRETFSRTFPFNPQTKEP